jgi:hypothetical protein
MNETNRIFLGGKLIGATPKTGDDTLDIDATIRLLKEKGLFRPPTAVQTMFGQASSFAEISFAIFAQGLSGNNVVPFVVNSAFALELYLKTLAKLYGIQTWGHDLLKLFELLPEPTQAAIEETFPQCRWQCGISTICDFREALKEMRNTFEEWRYLFEKERSGPINFHRMIFVMEALRNTCEQHEQIQNACKSSSRDVHIAPSSPDTRPVKR